MGTDPGPGRHRPEPAKHGSVACVVMSALCSRDSRVSLLLLLLLLLNTTRTRSGPLLLSAVAAALSRDSSLLISRLSRDYI